MLVMKGKLTRDAHFYIRLRNRLNFSQRSIILGCNLFLFSFESIKAGDY